MCKLEETIYLEKLVNRTLKTEKMRFQTFQRMRLTKMKKILMVQTKLEEWKRSLKVKRQTLLQSGCHRTQDYPQKPKWIAETVAGRGTGEQHRSRERQHAVPTIALKYLLVTNQKVLRRDELEGEYE